MAALTEHLAVETHEARERAVNGRALPLRTHAAVLASEILSHHAAGEHVEGVEKLVDELRNAIAAPYLQMPALDDETRNALRRVKALCDALAEAIQ